MSALSSSLDPNAQLVHCAPPLVRDEDRLAVLRSLAVLDTPPEAVFDALTRLATTLTGRPIGLIGLVDTGRTWFKSAMGMPLGESSNDYSFCARAITSDDVFEVPDAHRDPRFAGNPLVQGPPYVRFYAGAPLRVDGQPVGTICVVDHEPCQLDPEQRAALKDLALLACELLQARRRVGHGS